ncbi:hypothetical protein J0X14_18895 [Muricauda sp. CAU 1633]|uniref:hypothetical protein n=1 Tax=Allomuricauda sp. CAU 1633 TaxID=2816036 RepID=UPI001A8F6942|nr:hypothetical protein [Muricauda sp. CAU 1633]MBO0324383.1 hypothetical protein [Muricauda sp. CAU 1633]
MKNSTYHILFLILLIVPITSSGQTLFKNQVLGTWEHEKPKQDPELLLRSDKQSESNYVSKSIYFFQKDGVLDIKEDFGQFKANYSVSDSILTIGTRKYKILEYSQNQFSLEEMGDLVLFKKKLDFTRTDKTIEPIPFNQKILEFYENGNPKISGAKESGLEHGIWTEWHENGHVKSITYYNMGAPLMTAVFNEKGELISKSWFDLNSNSIRKD